MKKRLFALLLAACMLFCISSVASAYDYSIDGKYQVEYRINDGGFKTVGYLWVPCGQTVTVEYKWTTDPAYPYDYAWVLHVNGQKIPSIGLSYGWQYDSLEDATGIEGLSGFDRVPQYAVIRNGRPSPLCIEYTAPATGNAPVSKYFSLNKVTPTFYAYFEDKDGNRVEGLSYSYRPSSYGEFTIDEADVQAYLAENGYVLDPQGQSHTVNYTVDSSGKDVFEPSEGVFTVKPLQTGPQELSIYFTDNGTRVEELTLPYTADSEGELTIGTDDVRGYLAENGYILEPQEQSHTVNYSKQNGFDPSEVTFTVKPVSIGGFF